MLLHDDAFGNLRQRRQAEQHIRVGGIGERTVTLTGLDAPPELVSLFTTPDGPEIVGAFSQITHGLRPDAARPDVPIGSDLG